MTSKNSITKYKEAIQKNVGKEINLCIKRGRKMLTINNCTIENAYERIFVVGIFGESLVKESKISISYADLLTGNARVIVKNQKKLA